MKFKIKKNPKFQIRPSTSTSGIKSTLESQNYWGCELNL